MICAFCVIILGFLPFTLWAALRAFKNFPEIFVAAKIIDNPFAVMCRNYHSSFWWAKPPYACNLRLALLRYSPLVPVFHPSRPSMRVDHNIGA